MKIILNLIAAFMLACVSFGINEIQAPPKYNVTFIPGVECFGRATATDLNNLGDVTGYYEVNIGWPDSFLYSNGTVEVLYIDNGYSAMALGINDSRQIVGWTRKLVASFHAFSYLEGETTDIGDLTGAFDSMAYAVNNAGQVVGSSAFIFRDGKVITIDLPSSGAALAINDNYDSNGLGQVAGSFTDDQQVYHLFTYSNGTVTTYEEGYSALEIASINNLGQVVGSFYDTTTKAFIYNIKDGKYTFIGNNSQAVDINDAGQVVGLENMHFETKVGTPFLFMNGVKYNLRNLIISNLDITGIKPVAINNKGQILANSDRGPIILTPQ